MDAGRSGLLPRDKGAEPSTEWWALPSDPDGSGAVSTLWAAEEDAFVSGAVTRGQRTVEDNESCEREGESTGSPANVEEGSCAIREEARLTTPEESWRTVVDEVLVPSVTRDDEVSRGEPLDVLPPCRPHHKGCAGVGLSCPIPADDEAGDEEAGRETKRDLGTSGVSKEVGCTRTSWETPKGCTVVAVDGSTG